MPRAIQLLLGALVPISAVLGQPPDFNEQLHRYLALAPMSMTYKYDLVIDDVSRQWEGNIFIHGTGRFRVQLWDKIYASDSSSLYLHDNNTGQTVIDSLRWSDLNLWLRLLNGELPETVTVTSGDLQGNLAVYDLKDSADGWAATVILDTLSLRLVSIDLVDEHGYRHQLEIGVPAEFHREDVRSFYRLEDLPGTRLDLRQE
ncbi:MAG: hypothetical protein KAU50_00550 [Candidatus Marinimicrobia bacterium]|nr:hypothetical protein [Candidatus Neomarinimicrobiota bacterium]